MSIHDSQPYYRVPEPGDLVTRGTATTYRVVEVDPHVPQTGAAWRLVHLVSQRSGRRISVPLSRLYWPGKRPRETRVVPWEIAHPGTVRQQPDEDPLTAAVVAWQQPDYDQRPSSVGLAVRQDKHGVRYVALSAAGPLAGGGAFLDADAVGSLIDGLSRLARSL